jgi:integrase
VLEKEKIAAFCQIREVRKWLDESIFTSTYYPKRLYYFLDGEPPADFLAWAELMPKDLSIEIKGKLSKLYRHSPAIANHTRSALISFLKFYEADIHVNGRLPLTRRRQKPLITWVQGEHIIAECREPYRSAFRFMMWTGCGQDELFEINGSREIQKDISRQIERPETDDEGKIKDYVRINLRPRKTTLDTYFLLCPKKVLPSFPILTKKYIGRVNPETHIKHEDWGGLPLKLSDTIYRFHLAATKTGVYKLGMGPHTFRSAFSYQCDRAGVSHDVSEYFKGHGGSDRYGYNRAVTDENYDLPEIRKMWQFNEPATLGQVKAQEEQLAKQQQEIDKLKALVEDLMPDEPPEGYHADEPVPEEGRE